MRPVLILLTSLFIAAALHASGLEYLNTLRQKAGLMPFSRQSNLDNAAQNHSDYLQANNTSGHYENSGDPGYTGYGPSDRAVYARYPSRVVGENVSTGPKSDEESIDGLFSAIYHRFGFLSLQYDEVGIGVSENARAYTYDMGNSAVRDLCLGDSYTGRDSYFQGVCADETKKIDAEAFLDAMNGLKADAPELVIWPNADGEDIPPVFYEEHPDPLPQHGVTGYPISVEFNDEKFSEPPVLESFTLEDASGNLLRRITLMDVDNDPNEKFSGYRFALFPEKRLEWGSLYFAELVYTYDGATMSERWCFATRSLRNRADRFYRVENQNDASFDVLSGKSYAVYVVPKDTNDHLGGVRYSYTAQTTFDFIDSNTFRITLDGTVGDSARLTFSNGQAITFTVSDTDTAEPPSHALCLPEREDVSDTNRTDSQGEERAQEDTGGEENNQSAANDEEQNGSEGTENKDAAEQNTQREGTADTESGESENGTPDDAADNQKENGSETVSKNGPSARISVEEGTDGRYKPIDADRYGFSENGNDLYAQILEDGRLEYRVRNDEGETVVTVDTPGAEVKIDHRNIATVVPAGENGVEITVRPDGRVAVKVRRSPIHPVGCLTPGVLPLIPRFRW